MHPVNRISEVPNQTIQESAPSQQQQMEEAFRMAAQTPVPVGNYLSACTCKHCRKKESP